MLSTKLAFIPNYIRFGGVSGNGKVNGRGRGGGFKTERKTGLSRIHDMYEEGKKIREKKGYGTRRSC